MAGSQNFRQFDEIFIKIEIGNTIFRLIFHIVNYMGIVIEIYFRPNVLKIVLDSHSSEW